MKIINVFDALKDWFKGEELKPSAMRLERHHPSKHWIFRNGKSIRATKRYADGRQKGKRK